MRASMCFALPATFFVARLPKKPLANLSPPSALPPFFHDRQTADVTRSAAQLSDLILLVLIGLRLLVIFEQFLFEIVAVIAVVGRTV
jgi:hypothetical protein